MSKLFISFILSVLLIGVGIGLDAGIPAGLTAIGIIYAITFGILYLNEVLDQ